MGKTTQLRAAAAGIAHGPLIADVLMHAAVSPYREELVIAPRPQCLPAGTSSVQHLEGDSVAACTDQTAEQFDTLARAA
jgi:hypothetical protein